MKALTIWQPWASLIIIGAKPYEFRSWRTPGWLVGRDLAIHAAARVARIDEVRALIVRTAKPPTVDNPSTCLRAEIAVPFLERVLRGLEIEQASKTTAKLPAPADLFTRTPEVEWREPQSDQIREADTFKLPYSCILGRARVGDAKPGDLCAREFGSFVTPASVDDGEAYNWGWPLAMREVYMPPIEAKGSQGLWDWNGSERTLDEAKAHAVERERQRRNA